MVTKEEVGQALAVLLELATEMGGAVRGLVERGGEDGSYTVFHIDIHTDAACPHDFPPFPGGTLQ